MNELKKNYEKFIKKLSNYEFAESKTPQDYMVFLTQFC